MNRVEVTKDLSRRVESYMARRYHLWASEVYLSAYTHDGGTIDIRPDYLAFNLSSGNYASKAAWVERGEFTAFEVKSCKEDFESGHGLNLVGDKNYIVTTREFGEQLRGKLPSDCDGVLVPSGSGLRMLFEAGWHGGYRKFSCTELLWAIIRTGRAKLSSWRDATEVVGEGPIHCEDCSCWDAEKSYYHEEGQWCGRYGDFFEMVRDGM